MLRYIWLIIIGVIIAILIWCAALCCGNLERKSQVDQAYEMLKANPTGAGRR